MQLSIDWKRVNCKRLAPLALVEQLSNPSSIVKPSGQRVSHLSSLLRSHLSAQQLQSVETWWLPLIHTSAINLQWTLLPEATHLEERAEVAKTVEYHLVKLSLEWISTCNRLPIRLWLELMGLPRDRKMEVETNLFLAWQEAAHVVDPTAVIAIETQTIPRTLKLLARITLKCEEFIINYKNQKYSTQKSFRLAKITLKFILTLNHKNISK